MKTEILLLFLLIQFVVQLVMYIPFKKMIRRGYFFVFDIFCYINSILEGELSKSLLKPDYYVKFFAVSLFILNIIISFFVKFFTSEGAMTGMTNLFASVLIGCISIYDVYKFKKDWICKYQKL